MNVEMSRTFAVVDRSETRQGRDPYPEGGTPEERAAWARRVFAERKRQETDPNLPTWERELIADRYWVPLIYGDH